MALYGLDGSHYQATIIPQDFGIFKATEGTTYVDPTCDTKYQATKAAGKLVGVYHFADFGDAVAEANYYVDNVQGYLSEALLALDVETTANVAWTKQWLDQVYARTQVRPLVYMSASTSNAADWSSVSSDYALWVAGYPAEFNVANPPTPAPDGSDMNYKTGSWAFATIWQYSSSAGTLDRDIAYMTSDAWHKFAQGDRSETPQPTPAPSTPTPAPATTDQPAPEPTPATTDTPTAPTPPDVPTDTPSPASSETSPSPTPDPQPAKVTTGSTPMSTKSKLSDLLERAVWTFIQASAATLIVAGSNPTKAAGVAAVAAGLSALKNFGKQLFN